MSRDLPPLPYAPLPPPTAAHPPPDPASLPAPPPFIPPRSSDTFPLPAHPPTDLPARMPPIPPPSEPVPAALPRALPRDLPIPALPAQSLPPALPVLTPLEIAPLPSAPDASFPRLSDALLHHPFLPLLFPRVFAACAAPGLFRGTAVANHLKTHDATVRQILAVATAHGIHRACARWSATDIYMAALLSALETLRLNVDAGTPPPPHPLHHALTAGERALAAVAGRERAATTDAGLAASRTPLTEQAKERLENWFLENVEDPFPTDKDKVDLCVSCGMSMQSINNWFGNKRMRIKRKVLNLPPGTDEEGISDAASISDKVLSPRAKWKAVVVSRLRTKEGREIVLNAMGRPRSYGDSNDMQSDARSRELPEGSVGYPLR